MSATLVGWKGLSLAVLKKAGVRETGTGVLIPYRDLSGNLLYEKVRTPTTEWYVPRPSEVGGLVPFGLEALANPYDSDKVYIAEGESDCLALRDAYSYVPAVGCPGARTWRDEWTAYLDGFDFVYAFGDGDEQGREFAWSVRRSCPRTRPVVCPAGTDVRGLLQSGRLLDLDLLIHEANRMAALEHLFPIDTETEAPVDDGPAPYETYLYVCDDCGEERPHHWTGHRFQCLGCGT